MTTGRRLGYRLIIHRPVQVIDYTLVIPNELLQVLAAISESADEQAYICVDVTDSTWADTSTLIVRDFTIRICSVQERYAK